jgi:hypothetical protein
MSVLSSMLTAAACYYLLGIDRISDWRVAFAVRALLVSNTVAIETVMSDWSALPRSRRIRMSVFTVATFVSALLCWAYFATDEMDPDADVADQLSNRVLVISFVTLVLRLMKTLFKMMFSVVSAYFWNAELDPRDAIGLRMDFAEAVCSFALGIAYSRYSSTDMPWLLQAVMLQRLNRLIISISTCRRFDEITTPFPVAHSVPGDCVICLDPFTEPAGCRKLPCGHHFHDRCLRKWLMQSSQCPHCRRNPFSQRPGAAPAPPPPAAQDGGMLHPTFPRPPARLPSPSPVLHRPRAATSTLGMLASNGGGEASTQAPLPPVRREAGGIRRPPAQARASEVKENERPDQRRGEAHEVGWAAVPRGTEPARHSAGPSSVRRGRAKRGREEDEGEAVEPPRAAPRQRQAQ